MGGERTLEQSPPESTGPLAGQWLPAGSQQACFERAGTGGKITQSGLVLRNAERDPIEILGFTMGAGSANMSIIGQQMLPVLNTEVLGDSKGYPPKLTPTESERFKLSELKPAVGYILQPVTAGGGDTAIFAGLQFEEEAPAVLTYIDVAYRYRGASFHVYTPEAIHVVDSQRDCAMGP
ncbi:hypothetical protein GCM10027053_18110 [Intrasporangium mesophilum]